MSDGHLTITPDNPSSVAPNEIERVLQQLWRDSAGEEAETTVVQVRTLNLLIVVPEALARPELFRTIDAVALQHPGRTITMVVAPGEQEAQADVALACRFGEGGKQFCGEQITIRCGDRGAPLPSIVAALLVAGVPTFLWWVGDPPLQSQRFDTIIDSVDRVLLDSRTWDTPTSMLDHLSAAVRRHPFISFSDLQWAALTPWRRQTAQCFDLPDALPSLTQLEQITIRHGVGDADRVAALLFVGWLATRLGWRDGVRDGDGIAFSAGQRQVAVRFEAGPGDAPIHGVELRAPNATFTLSLPAGHACVTTNIELRNAPDIHRVAKLSTLALEQIVGEELNMLSRDVGFEEALGVATALARQLDA